MQVVMSLSSIGLAKIPWESKATLLWANMRATINITSPYIYIGSACT
jgi:hypothetical protein